MKNNVIRSIQRGTMNKPVDKDSSFPEWMVAELTPKFSGKDVVIAGGTGMIGRQLAWLLAESGARVLATGLEDFANAQQLLGREIDYAQIDFTVAVPPGLLSGAEFVFNLLGTKGSVGIGETKVASYLVPMLRYQSNLIEAAHKADVARFLFVSSVNVYPQSELHFEDNAWSGLPLQNDRIPGIGKRVGEILGLAYELEYGWDATRIVRPANVYGAFDVIDPVRSQVIPSLMMKFLSTSAESIEVWGDGTAVRDFVYSKDMAYWFSRAITELPPNFPTNLGSGQGISIRELACQIRDVVAPSKEILFNASRPTGDPVRLLDVTRAVELMGYRPITTLKVGITETLDWISSLA